MASNRNALKKYAPQARLDFIQAVTNRAAQFGITKSRNESGETQGDLFILNGKAFPRSVATQRSRLIARIAREGFGQVMEAIAYTWFNRFLAIRYMEVHNYLDHGCLVLSGVGGQAEPEILEKATTVNLPGLDREEIVNLKLDGTKDEQIYRRLLIAQCNALHQAMPFLFERIDDETELLLPENLLQSDSIVRKLVNEIDEAEWQEIEIIGWLYQFYISEKKDQVIGKVVKSEDIPAATQLFTPNWIVKYMVQNSLGAQWLATYPDSGIRGNYPMDYYVTPAEQTPEVQAQIDAITPDHLDPEAITLIDPAVGSGHILVEAYDLFRAIYLERGYTKREAARAILTKNLFGLDIDDRAAQMAGFALLMKACADDRSVLRNPPHLNVLALQDSGGLDAEALTKALLPQEQIELVPSSELFPDAVAQPTLAAQKSTSAEVKAIAALVKLFVGAKTFGSLITVPETVMQSLPLIDDLLARPLTGDLFRRQAQEDAHEVLKRLAGQARLLGCRYDCVVANPPYMGGKGMNTDLKAFAGKRYPDSKADLFAAFIERGFEFIRDFGRHSMVTMQSWMFLSSYEKLRERLLSSATISAMAHMGNGVMGIAFGTAASNFQKAHFKDAKGAFCRVENDDIRSYKPLAWPPKNERNSQASPDSFFHASASDFAKMPGSPIAYWASENFIRLMENAAPLGQRAFKGLDTGGDINRYYRLWWEVNSQKFSKISENSDYWYPIAKGGAFRRWYGNHDFIINYSDEGRDLRMNSANLRSRNKYFQEGASWTVVSNGGFAVRYMPSGFLFDQGGSGIFADMDDLANEYKILGSLNNKINKIVSNMICPTLNYTTGDVRKFPVWSNIPIDNQVKELIDISKGDWDNFEYSWDFSTHPLLKFTSYTPSLEVQYATLRELFRTQTTNTQRLEEENNHLFIEAYGLQDEITPDVPLSEITLNCNPHYRYGGELTDEERQARLKSDTMRELVSYAVGCMMGRYSLAEPGLIYARSGGVGFDLSRYGAFSADDDGIIPLTEERWFPDDVGVRIEQFLGVAWPTSPIMETLTTLMNGLTMGKGGEPRSALRAYLSKQFYKDHLQTYKNRPIYWLFSSGKQKAFEALVYLHRYNEGTLARMRTNYVTPLMGKLQQRISDLDAEIAASSSTAEKTRKGRDKDKLSKQLVELQAFDEELRHLADQRIPLDLDDGVKVNYGRFGNLLAFKDKVCGKGKGGDQ